MVHFFATWCETCKSESGTLEAFFHAHTDRINLLAIDVGEVPARVRRFVKETAVTFPVLLDADRAVTKAWGVEGLPSTFVLDANLRPILAASGEIDWSREDVLKQIIEAGESGRPSLTGCTKEITP